jgi:sugar lactone lactonase YvrE
MKRRLILSLGLVLAFTLVAVPTVAAHGNGHHQKPLPTQIDLPVGFQPEGLTSSPSGKLYVGSVATGAIWAGSSKTGVGAVIVPGMAGRSAAGLHLDWRGRLWVAGASNGTIRVYDPRTGTLLKEYVFPTAAFVNDLVITHTAVYATDSLNQQLLVVPIGKRGKLVDPSKATTRPLTGDLAYTMGFNANGIVANGRSLILVQSNTGLLFKVNPKTGSTEAIDTHGYLVTNGDGLVLSGRNLYVIRNRDNLVAVLRLSKSGASARLVRTLTSPNLDIPTTGAFAGGKLWVVNARFGTPSPATAEYWITRLPAHK